MDVVEEFSKEEIFEGLVGPISKGVPRHGKLGVMVFSSWVASGDEVEWVMW